MPGKSIHISVVGKAQTAGSKRVVRTKAGRSYVIDANPKSKEWKATVAKAAADAQWKKHIRRHPTHSDKFYGPCKIEMTFYIQRPKYHYRKGKYAGVIKDKYKDCFPTGKPDAVKLARGTEDALTGIVYRDDSQNVTVISMKRWADDRPIGAEIHVEEIGEAV